MHHRILGDDLMLHYCKKCGINEKKEEICKECENGFYYNKETESMIKYLPK